jgi:hypothetical protein
MDEFKKHWPNQLKEWAESAKVAKDEAEKLDFEDGVHFAQRVIDTFPQLELRLPDHTFTDRVEFKRSHNALPNSSPLAVDTLIATHSCIYPQSGLCSLVIWWL